jgi:Flp pilus assembly protein TadG
MMQSRCAQMRRRAATLPLFALLVIPLLGMLAFSIDVGWIVLVGAQLQTAADAAALAGAEKLQQLYVQYTLPNQTATNAIFTTATTNTPGSPMAAANKIASYNKVGNVSITVPDEDVSFSFLDATGIFHKNYRGEGLNGGFPNSITVIARRDRFANSPLSLFFGPVFGFSSKEMTATATATIYSGEVSSLQPIPGVKAHILPAALDMNIWQTFYQTGLSSDGSMHFAANGYPQLQVYPSANAPGSFGPLDVGPLQNNMPVFRTSSGGGQTPNDISYFINNNLVPVSVNSPKSWKAGQNVTSLPGIDYQGIMGQPYLIPLFRPVNPNFGPTYQAATLPQGDDDRTNPSYAIVGFVGINVSQADANGGSMTISIQPCAIVDPTAVSANPKAIGTQQSQFPGTIITTFTGPKLTQ